jgi:hypothetical protein
VPIVLARTRPQASVEGHHRRPVTAAELLPARRAPVSALRANLGCAGPFRHSDRLCRAVEAVWDQRVSVEGTVLGVGRMDVPASGANRALGKPLRRARFGQLRAIFDAKSRGTWELAETDRTAAGWVYRRARGRLGGSRRHGRLRTRSDIGPIARSASMQKAEGNRSQRGTHDAQPDRIHHLLQFGAAGGRSHEKGPTVEPPGLLGSMSPAAQSFLMASVSAGTVSNKSATRK